ncbi:SDR family NAD(P)-dependent oxidoreductase [Galbitalea sp. SE-J8]|uniref:SDR family NAD(P)-dependent oxidoreductase n=1 Tax=Galbitalea sp. SE-J8 TaxID=3054952 RepID=UPI00259CEB77|nr:SDR family NAD(P)-dependent oxidoreductase [Galbitalea sp. SE-J8]MDM4763837.1 SDR family NAD(P)-dependent oxidoreductase [Galbitalea sp. SE-J8]
MTDEPTARETTPATITPTRLPFGPHWNELDVPDQTGRTALVTGATGGLGLRVATVLASAGARVLLASRNAERGERARQQVAAVATDAAPEVVELDIADPDSVARAADDIRRRTGDRLDLLVNNAGIMAPPLRFADDGTELQWATNVFGPAALTWRLLPAIERVSGSRVVFVSSIVHFRGRFDALRLERDGEGLDYSPFAYYARTKLADLLLSRELERHFRRTRASTIALAAHPGFSSTGLVDATVADRPAWLQTVASRGTRLTGQPVEAGALPLLYAATATGVRGAQYYGPAWAFESRGPVTRAARSPSSRSDELGALLLGFVSRRVGLDAPR